MEDKPEEMLDKDWDKINRQACGTIRLCLAKDQKYFVMRKMKAKDLWKMLEDKYMTKSVENRLYLKKKLFRFQYRVGISMSEHLNDYNKILADLQNLEVEIKDEDKALLLLNSLRDTYDHLITTLLYGNNEIKFNDVSNALTNNEYRKKDRQAYVDTSSEALMVRGRFEQKKSGRRGRSHSKSKGFTKRKIGKDECAFCRNKRHWKKACPLLKNKDKKDSNANVAHSTDKDSDFALTGSSFVCHSDEWIMDYACTFHMCPKKECFYNLDELVRGSVLMGNDEACKILGMGKIKLKLHDGTIRNLTKVRYIPDLKKNLISVGFLESKGFKITMENGILKVSYGAFVALRATRKRNMYFLDGSTIVGGATTVSDITRDVASDTTRLWHMHLGHASGNALQSLVKQGLLKGGKTCKLDFCEHCVLGKQTRVKFDTAVHQTKGTLDYVHTDVWGPTKVASLGGKYYYVTFVDDYSRRV